MPSLKANDRPARNDRNTLIVNLKTNAVMTVDRGTVDEMARFMGQDTTSLVHLALARLRDEIQRGHITALSVLPPLATAWPTAEEMGAIRAKVDEGRTGGGTWQGDADLDAAMALL